MTTVVLVVLAATLAAWAVIEFIRGVSLSDQNELLKDRNRELRLDLHRTVEEVEQWRSRALAAELELARHDRDLDVVLSMVLGEMK